MWEFLRKAVRAKPGSPYKSPTMHMALAMPMPMGDMETIDAFAVPPWEPSLERMVDITRDREEAVERCLNPQETEVQIFTDGSMKKGKVGYSVVVWVDNAVRTHVQRTIGTDDGVDVYIAELGAIMEAVDWANVILNDVAESRRVTKPSPSQDTRAARHSFDTLLEPYGIGKEVGSTSDWRGSQATRGFQVTRRLISWRPQPQVPRAGLRLCHGSRASSGRL
ncbi:hypothetical protein BKA61DRAFT_278301 [Leptodontidium sp. MPI-SDFR-AT-0119]|nr:hypothetical protein BKA61DRAFT_278301 [Leptodontidium sp. MPI-SDFR-AT-0119]